MKLPKDLEKLMIEQMRNEFESAYVYLGMSSAMARLSFSGTAKWMRSHAKEEVEHATKFYDYLLLRGSRIELSPIGQVSTDYESPLKAFETALANEKKVTATIHKIYDLAVSTKDYEAQNMLDWFIGEQVEEEDQTQYFTDRFSMAKGHVEAILHIDGEAGKKE
jgi:ferritin